MYPQSLKPPIIHFVLQGYFAFSLPRAQREQAGRSCLLWFTCVWVFMCDLILIV